MSGAGSTSLAERLGRLSPAQRRLLELRLEERGESAAELPIPRRSGGRSTFPSSFAQQRVWFLQQLDPGDVGYHIVNSALVSGPLEARALAQAVDEIARRHESLRTTFRAGEPAPLQVVHPPSRGELPVVDLRRLGPEAEREGRRLARGHGRRRFDLSRGPLLRVRLFILGPRRHVLSLVLHHLVCDGWSLRVLWRELVELYDTFRRGGPSSLGELPIQYGEFAAWQRQRQDGEALERHLAALREELSGIPETLEIPTDRPRPAVQSSRGAGWPVALAPPLVEGLRSLGRESRATLFMVLMAGYQALLARLCGQDDFAVGIPIAGRARAETEDLIGFFVNTLVVRSSTAGTPAFRALLERIRRRVLDAHEREDLPFERLVAELRPERSLAHAPFFQALFSMQVLSPEAALADRRLTPEGLRLAPFDSRVGATIGDLMLELGEAGDGVTGRLLYRTDLFDATTAGRWIGHLEVLLRAAVAEPERPLAELPLLDAAQRWQLLGEWNDTAAVGEEPATLAGLVADRARSRPEAVAVVCGERNLTYGALARRAEALGQRLEGMDVGPEVPVGLLGEPSAELLVGLLGISWAGGAYVPLDPGHPGRRLQEILADCAAPVLVTEERLLARLGPGGPRRVLLDEVPGLLAAGGEQGGSGWGEPRATAESLAYVIYTSGSTGQPKGVACAHAGVVRLLSDFVRWWPHLPGDRASSWTSLSFDASILEIFPALVTGGTVEVVPPELRPDGERFVAWLEERRIAGAYVPPFFLPRLEEAVTSGAIRPPLTRLLVGVEPIPEPRLARITRALPGLETINGYGPTESTVCTTIHPVRPERARPGRTPLGRPVAGLAVHLVDPELRPVPLGAAGELAIGGAGMARGYQGRPAQTAERFVPDPFGAPGSRLYRTGDLARRLGDGEVVFLGRLDQQVKVRGVRVEPREAESALLDHPEVRDAVVAARREGESAARLVAWVVPAAAVADEAEWAGGLRRFLAERLPAYLVPAAFVPLAELPATPTGKIDRRRLPEPRRPAASPAAAEAPSTPAERRLAAIWSEVLERDAIGRHENFFEVGGDSILAMQVVARARAAGLRLEVQDVVRDQTLAALAAVAVERAGAGGEPPPAKEGPVAGPVPLTPVQRFFLDADPVDPHHFNQAVLLATEPEMSAAVVARALALLVVHHDALRLRLRREAGGWLQEIAPPEEAPGRLSVVDLSGLGDGRGRELARWLTAAQESLDLARAPLVRAILFRLGAAERGRLLLAIHHLAVDGVSWRVLLSDLAAAYGALAAGRPPALPPKTASFRRWAERLADHARSPASTAEVEAWRRLAAAPVDPLPFEWALDRDRGEATAGTAERHVVRFSAEETRKLLAGVPGSARAGPDEVLLAALARVLAEWSGARRFLVDVERHGRDAGPGGLDVSRTVGWFTSIHPLLLDLGGVPDEPAAVLGAVRTQMRSVPRSWLGRGLAGAPPPRAAPVAFNYLGRFGAELDSASAPWALAPEPVTTLQSPRAARTHPLSVDAAVVGGRLQAAFTYSPEGFGRSAVEELGRRFAAVLGALIAGAGAGSAAAAVAPSDVPLAGVTAEELREVLAELDPADRLEDLYPLSPVQEGMLFHSLAAPGSGVYLTQLRCRLDGPLDAAAFARSWRLVVERHPVFRTAFVGLHRRRPLQAVVAGVEVPLAELDWRDVPADRLPERLAAFADAESRRDFDLRRPPLLRLALLRVGDERHHLVATVHHLLLDGWSWPVVVGEQLAGYRALARGEEPRLAPARPYRDYIAWLETAAAERAAGAEELWRKRLREVRSATPLPMAAEAAGEAAPAFDEAVARVPAEPLEALARRCRVTLSTLVEGAWGILLARHAGEREVLFGGVVSGRPVELPGVEAMVGLFINTLPVRLVVDEAAPVGRWLAALALDQAEARRYEHVPLVAVRRWSRVPADRPLFESLVVVENYPVAAGLLGGAGDGLTVGEASGLERTHYPLTLTAVPGRELALRLTYDRSRLDAAGARLVLERLRGLLLAMARAPERPLGELAPWTAADLQRVREWNDTAAAVASEVPLHAGIVAQAARTPEAVAVEIEGRCLSYGELERRSDRWARRLVALGVEPEAPVGVCCERSLELMVALVAVLRAGAAYLPLDPEYPDERLGLMLADAGAQVVLAAGGTGERLAGLGGRVRVVDLDGEAGQAEPAALPEVAASQLAYVIYTSGSTGRPKGVMTTHRAVANRLLWMERALGWRAGERVLQKTPTSFDVSVWELFAPLLWGGRVVLARPGGHRDPDYLAAAIARAGIETLHFVPAMLRAFLDAPPGRPLPGVRRVVTSGEALATDLAERALRRFPAAELWNLYGPTEAAVDVTAWRCRGPVPAEGVPIGSPIWNTRVEVVDERGRPVAPGVAGELVLGGVQVARGYLGRPALTAERFVPDPSARAAGSRRYRTGDRAAWRPDGTLGFLGRLDYQVKVRGVRVEPGEVEAALLDHPEVRDAVVAARGDGESGARLVAWVVPAAEVADESEWTARLRRSLAARLPAQLVPAVFVPLPALPLTPTGKVDRRRLPEPERSASAAAAAEPPTPAEERLARIWSESLGRDGIGRHQNFFEIGGDSILAMQVVARAQREGIELRIQDLHRHPTVAALAAAARMAERPGRGRGPVADQGPVTGPVPLTPVQREFLEAEPVDPHHFNQAVLLAAEPGVSAAALARAVALLVAHHDALRLRFRREAGGWRQEIAPPREEPARLAVVDLAALAARADERRRELARLLVAAQASLDLGRGPLVRAILFRLGAEERGRLLLVVHHLAVDGVSWRILLSDLAAAYGALAAGVQPALPPKSTSFRRWAERLVEHARSPGLAAEAEAWRRLAAAPADALPLDHRRGDNTVGSAATATGRLEPEETRRLLEVVPAAWRARPEEVLVASLAYSLRRWSGRRRLAVDLEGHGREDLFPELDLHRTVGWFTSIYPVRWDLGRAAVAPGPVLRAVKEALRAIPGRGLGWGLLRHLGAPDRPPAVAALPSPVLFNYLGRLDGVLPPGSAFTPASEPLRGGRSARALRRYLFDVVAGVRDGRLWIECTYSRNLHRPETAEAVIAGVLDALRWIVAPEREAAEIGYVPSDFAGVELSREALADLVEEIGP